MFKNVHGLGGTGDFGIKCGGQRPRRNILSNLDRYDYAFDIEGDSWPARLLRNVPPGCSVLELGPGAGVMTKVLLDRGCQVTAVENDPEALRVLHSMGVHAIAADLDRPDWAQQLGPQRFDAVLACDVLEHLHQPDRVLRTLIDLVEPTGKIGRFAPQCGLCGSRRFVVPWVV